MGGEALEIREVPRDNGFDNVEVERLVVVDGDVSEADHSFEPAREVVVQEASLSQKREGVAAALRRAEALPADEVHRKVNGGLAGALQVEHDGVLAREVVEEVLRLAGVLLADAPEAPLDDGRLAERDVIRHRRAPAGGCRLRSRCAPR